MWLKSRLCVFISIHGHRHAHLFLSVVFFLVSLYLVLKSFFHLFLNPTMVLDENSMEDPLCSPASGAWSAFDYVTPDTNHIADRRYWWNSKRADVQFSVQRLHCPGVSSKAKDTENCRFTIVLTRQRLRLFFE